MSRPYATTYEEKQDKLRDTFRCVSLYWILSHYSWLQQFISLKTWSVCPQQTMEIHDYLLSFTFDLAHSGIMEIERWLGKRAPKTPSGGQTCPHRDANIHQHRQKEMGKIKNVMTYKKGQDKTKNMLSYKIYQPWHLFLGWHFWD